jgi:hypothetical protein
MSAEQIQSHREIRGACQSDAFQSLIVQWQPAGPSDAKGRFGRNLS